MSTSRQARRAGWLCTCAVFAAVAISPATLRAAPILLSDVPAYNWYHGCGPTAVGMILGYWDLHGYRNLFQASGLDLYLTSSVQDEISSPAHNAKYDPTPDNPNLSKPPMTSVADFLYTSVDPGSYGGTSLSNARIGLVNYAAYKGYTFTARTDTVFAIYWNNLVKEINAGRPLLLMVDSNADGNPDHFVPAFGYDDRGAEGKWYACYTTWSEDETPAWYPFKRSSPGNSFGVSYLTAAVPEPIPEPLTVALLGAGALVLLRGRRRQRRP